MELYEIKNGLDKAHLLIEEFYRSIDIESYRREIEGLTIVTEQDNFGMMQIKLKLLMIN